MSKNNSTPRTPLCGRTMYLTALHLVAIASIMGNYLYISDSYALIKLDKLNQYEAQQEAAQHQDDGTQYAMILGQAGKEAKHSAFDALNIKPSKKGK